MTFVEYRVPPAIKQIRRILPIPAKKTESRLVRHLTAEEIQTILDAPDSKGWGSIRDRAMLQLCYAGALRVSELTGLRLDDLAGFGVSTEASVLSPPCSPYSRAKHTTRSHFRVSDRRPYSLERASMTDSVARNIVSFFP
jgi:hypothetical protein